MPEQSNPVPKYKRVLLKLSGEALMGPDQFGINRATLAGIVEDIKEVLSLGVELGIVVGGGNIFRGVALGATGMDRATGDYMGMLATVMNGMALQDALRNAGVENAYLHYILLLNNPAELKKWAVLHPIEWQLFAEWLGNYTPSFNGEYH